MRSRQRCVEYAKCGRVLAIQQASRYIARKAVPLRRNMPKQVLSESSLLLENEEEKTEERWRKGEESTRPPQPYKSRNSATPCCTQYPQLLVGIPWKQIPTCDPFAMLLLGANIHTILPRIENLYRTQPTFLMREAIYSELHVES